MSKCLAKNTNTNTKYTCDTGQTRNKLLEQWVHLTNHTAGHSRPTAHFVLQWQSGQYVSVAIVGCTRKATGITNFNSIN